MPGKPAADRPLCRSTTAAGAPCRNKAAAGSAYCGTHGGGKRRPGAPSKFDEATRDAIIEEVARGNFDNVAAHAAGIAAATLGQWKTRGNDDLEHGRQTEYAEFVTRLSRASAEAELHMVQRIRAQAGEDWRAAAFYLERKAPERWARKDKLDVSTDTVSIPREVTPTGGKRDAVIRILQTATAPPAGGDT